MQNLLVVVQDQFPTEQSGSVTSAYNFFREIGAALGIAVVGSAFTGRLTSGLQQRARRRRRQSRRQRLLAHPADRPQPARGHSVRRHRRLRRRTPAHLRLDRRAVHRCRCPRLAHAPRHPQHRGRRGAGPGSGLVRLAMRDGTATGRALKSSPVRSTLRFTDSSAFHRRNHVLQQRQLRGVRTAAGSPRASTGRRPTSSAPASRSLAAACFLVRDGQMKGEHITILEKLPPARAAPATASRTPTEGFVIRGGREMENHFECLWDALPLDPLAPRSDGRQRSRRVLLAQQGRPQLLAPARHGEPRPGRPHRRQVQLSEEGPEGHSQALPHHGRGPVDKRITDVLSEDFFDTNFWLYWRTMFAFETRGTAPWR